MIDFVIEKISKLFFKDHTKDEYFMRNLTTPDRGSWGENIDDKKSEHSNIF